ncbi:MAG TPA: hypothetical protein VES40_10305 [Ilumatobacteraceae bacterium]|nr:hypothetical protein [Ilumatobacteraceae bacterium]
MLKPGRSRRRRFTLSGLRQVVEDRNEDELEVEGDGFSLSTLALAKSPGLHLNVVVDVDDDHDHDWSVVDSIADLDGFVAASLGDHDDFQRQSTKQLSTYRLMGWDIEGLAMTVDAHGREIVDISGHPGRAVVGPGFWLWAGSVLWFADPAFSVIDRERLHAFGDEVQTLDSGVVKVSLFGLDQPLPVIRAQQRRFREWMRYDEIESTADLFVPSGEPTIEISEAVGGDERGARTIVEWLSDDLTPVSRARATWKRTSLSNGRGDIVSTEINRVVR